MRILWISHFLLFPQTGYGALQRSRNLLIELSKRHDIYLLSYYRQSDLGLAPDLKVAQADLEKYCNRVVLMEYPPDQAKYRRFFIMLKSLLSGIPYSVLLYRSKAMSEKISEIIAKFNIDLVHSDTMGLFEDRLDESRSLKVLNHHNIESEMMFRRAERESNIFKRGFFRIEARRLRRYEMTHCSRYNLNIVVSERDRENFMRMAPELKSAIIENGVDCEYFVHHLRDEQCRGLIFTGSLDWYPNLDAMLYFCREIWPLLRIREDAPTLTIIGKHPSKELAHIVKKDKNISLIGFVSDLREYTKKAKVFVCPIRDGGGTRLKILDALAQGIPVVSTEIGCEGLYLRNGDQILIADTPSEFARQVNLLLSDEALCNRLSQNGRRFVEKHYSFRVLGEKLSGRYEQLMRTFRGSEG